MITTTLPLTTAFVLESRVSAAADDDSSDLYNILQSTGTSAVSFFINGINTTTQGVDFVASYRKIRLGTGYLNASLAANYNINEQRDEANTPETIAATGGTIFNNVEKAIIAYRTPAQI